MIVFISVSWPRPVDYVAISKTRNSREHCLQSSPHRFIVKGFHCTRINICKVEGRDSYS